MTADISLVLAAERIVVEQWELDTGHRDVTIQADRGAGRFAARVELEPRRAHVYGIIGDVDDLDRLAAPWVIPGVEDLVLFRVEIQHDFA